MEICFEFEYEEDWSPTWYLCQNGERCSSKFIEYDESESKYPYYIMAGTGPDYNGEYDSEVIESYETLGEAKYDMIHFYKDKKDKYDIGKWNMEDMFTPCEIPKGLDIGSIIEK